MDIIPNGHRKAIPDRALQSKGSSKVNFLTLLHVPSRRLNKLLTSESKINPSNVEINMFLSDFSGNDKQTFMELARMMIAIDDELAPEELEMLSDVAAEMEIDVDLGNSKTGLEELCARVTNTQSHALMLLELASIARVDNRYANEERELFRKIAHLWKTDQITTIRIEMWAEKRIQLSREAAEVVREITSPFCRSAE